MDSHDMDYQKHFEHAIFNVKGGLVLLLLILTAFYQLNSKDVNFTNTFFKDQDHIKSAVMASAVGASIACLTTLYIMGSRGFFSLYVLALIFLILFAYDLAMESSGTNRWLASTDVQNGIGPYANLNGITDQAQMNAVKDADSVVKPYTDSLANTFMLFVGIIVAYFCWVMIKCTWQGASSGEHNIFGSKYWNGMNPALGFFLEVLFMGSNASIPLVAAYIKGDEINKSVYANSAMFGIGSIVLHVMFQYCGFYDDAANPKN